MGKERKSGRPPLRTGAPRKLSRDQIINAAIALMADEGYRALSLRSLATRLNASHVTLYSYFEQIEDIEAEALSAIMSRVKMPARGDQRPLRLQLIEHLLSVREYQARHPHVLFAPLGSPAWKVHVQMYDGILEAFSTCGHSPLEVALAYDALVAYMGARAERTRSIKGNIAVAFAEALEKLPPENSSRFRAVAGQFANQGARSGISEPALELLIDRLLPKLGDSRPE